MRHATKITLPSATPASASVCASLLIQRPLHRSLWCHGTWYVRQTRGGYAYGVRCRGAPAALSRQYVQHAGGGYAQPVGTVRRPRDVRVNTARNLVVGGTAEWPATRCDAPDAATK